MNRPFLVALVVSAGVMLSLACQPRKPAKVYTPPTPTPLPSPTPTPTPTPSVGPLGFPTFGWPSTMPTLPFPVPSIMPFPTGSGGGTPL